MPTHWIPLDPSTATAISDARRQLHHAAQFATALGISYLPHAADDSHTNLEWLPDHQALASACSGNVRVAVRVPDLTLLLLSGEAVLAEYGLRDTTIDEVTALLRRGLKRAGLDDTKYTLARHYEIPAHPVGSGARFSANGAQLEMLARWFENAASALEAVRIVNDGSAIRCWPHHFDIATLLALRPDASVGVGLELGDGYYDEPYFYVNAHPQPSADALTDSLEGGGTWHTREWIGAVLPGSHLSADASMQEGQVHAFLDSAVRAARMLIS